MRQTFAVGRIHARRTEVVMVGEPSVPPFPGPWALHALVRLED